MSSPLCPPISYTADDDTVDATSWNHTATATATATANHNHVNNHNDDDRPTLTTTSTGTSTTTISMTDGCSTLLQLLVPPTVQQQEQYNNNNNNSTNYFTFHITGHVAYRRIQPLLLSSSNTRSSTIGVQETNSTSSSTGRHITTTNRSHDVATTNNNSWNEYTEFPPVLQSTVPDAAATVAVVSDNDHKDAFEEQVVGNKTPPPKIVPPLPLPTTTSTRKNSTLIMLHFLWENTPRSSTKELRDTVRCYSHLPNGMAIFDSKHVLGRLMGQSLLSNDNNSNKHHHYIGNHQPFVSLTTHCFRGRAGYRSFVQEQRQEICWYDRQQSQQQQQQQQHDTVNATASSTDTDTDIVVATPTTTPVAYLDLLEHDFSSYRSSRSCCGSTVTDDHTSCTDGSDMKNNRNSIVGSTDCSSRSNHENSNNNNNNNSMWVVKDAHSNGAGGVWVLGLHQQDQQPPDAVGVVVDHIAEQLYDEHSYVAQQYVHPMVLFRQRKCHVRVYVLITSDHRAFVHHQCFVHVANDVFTTASTTVTTRATNNDISDSNDTGIVVSLSDATPYHDSVHITNCCANSHNPLKFAGEICADLNAKQHRYRNHSSNAQQENDHDMILGLQPFASSIYASVERLVQVTAPFVQGGQPNNGFEYLGLDFILSYDEVHKSNDGKSKRGSDTHFRPLAYLLEVNAPPSQDTATKLPHAEDVHDTVLRDLLHLWVYPHVVPNVMEQLGGWYCVYDGRENGVPKAQSSSTTMLPSKAAILNKIRWNLFERQQLKIQQQRQKQRLLHHSVNTVTNMVGTTTIRTGNDAFANFSRRYFPYYQQEKNGGTKSISTSAPIIFFENAGGSQVPEQVIQSMNVSLSNRHRSVIGTASVLAAKDILSTLLGASPSTYDFYFGCNASTLLNNLARWYIRTNQIQKGDEILIQTENHVANVSPWIELATTIGATIRWWDSSLVNIIDLLTPKTRIVAACHASNVLGQGYHHKNLRQLVDEYTRGYGHIIVDGVTYVPHRYAAIDDNYFDWYVISCHKLFGPHFGVLLGRRAAAVNTIIVPDDSNVDCDSFDGKTTASIRCPQTTPTKSNDIQFGTVNYEACEGVRGLGRYFMALSTYSSTNYNADGLTTSNMTDMLMNKQMVLDTYRLIEITETALVKLFMYGLQRSKKVRIIEDTPSPLIESNRLPIVSLVHETIRSGQIVDKCCEGGILCRNGTFLSTEQLQQRYSICDEPMQGVVRFSMAHYNTCNEVTYALNVLESIPGWM